MKIAIVGEAWGEQEEKERMPFVGASGWHLTQMLNDAGIDRAECFLTNVFNLHPPKNNLEAFCCPKKDSPLSMPALTKGKYLRGEFWPEVERLYRELEQVKPNVTIALGNTACWALLSNTGISKIRGTVVAAQRPRGFKVLPTYHPAAVLRDWSLRAVTVLDLMKAKRQSEFPEIRRPNRTIYTEPTLIDIEWFYHNKLKPARYISYDIETKFDQIEMVGFGASKDCAMVIPFWDKRKPNWSYWPTLEEELKAWDWVEKCLHLPNLKIGQNILYDIQFTWRGYGIYPKGEIEDTMLMHHAIQPESLKGLGFLGSVYTDEPAWKTMRSKGKTTTKRDE